MTQQRAARGARDHLPFQPGRAPGTLDIDPDAPRPVIRVFAYGPDAYEEREIANPSDLLPFLEKWPVVWVNVFGLGDEAVLRELGSVFDLHRLALEDVVSSGQRPKVEPYENFLFAVARMPLADGREKTEQLSIFLGHGFLLTLQEQPGDYFDGVRDRIRHGRGLIRKYGSDYLTYALLDAVVDAYFPVIEAVRDEFEILEAEVLESPEAGTVEKIHSVKQRLLALRRVISPHREAINALIRDSGDFVKPETSVYLRDCYDHLFRLTERVEIYREQCADLMSTYLSIVSNRMNEVMRTLTVMASIFIPLTFLAGIYGMNFNPDAGPLNMPELNWRWGYPVFWIAILAMAGGLILFFRRRHWW